MKRVQKKQVGVQNKGLSGYAPFLGAVKDRIRAAQVRATLSANAELIYLYWDIGRAIAAMQEKEGWGAGVIPRLARDIANDMPEVKGFSERNLKYMIRFAREYGPRPIVQQPVAQLPEPAKRPVVLAQLPSLEISPQAAAKLVVPDDLTKVQQLVAQIPWGQNVILLDKVKDPSARLWYVQQTITHGWSRNVLALQIKSGAHARAGKAVHNFHATLPPPQSDLAAQVLKDPYIFDFLTLAEPFRERELELALLDQVQKFLLELGQGFAFVGRQYHLEVADDDFYLDLLFYHLRLRCFVVVDLKRGPFKAEYAGKMNFYCNVVDDHLRHADDKPTIGLILCQDKNRIIAEYALKGVKKAIGVSEYQLTRALPKAFRSSLPTVEEMETELTKLTAREARTGKGNKAK
jgi:predicted nuclease of restriction endonuclease-like (RecB) superfamily